MNASQIATQRPSNGQLGSQFLKSGVGVEKVPFRQKQAKFRGYKMPWNPRGSFIAHPDAILFLRFWRERVFQQPLPISLIDSVGDRATALGSSVAPTV